MSTDALQALGAAAARLGEDGFHAALGAAFGDLLGYERWLVMRYGGAGPPTFLANEAISEEAVALYRAGLHRLDPFNRLAQAGGPPQVQRLSTLRDRDAGPENRYYDAVFRTMMIGDEIAMLLPLGPREQIALCLDQDQDAIPDADEARATAALPLFLSLHTAHLRLRGQPDPTVGAPDPAPPTAPRLPAYDDLIATIAERHGMTARERDITHRALRGYPNVLIARDLGISAGTVRNHRARLYAKLDITTERELFALCVDALLAGEGGGPD